MAQFINSIGITEVCLIIMIALQVATLHRQYRGNPESDEPITAADAETPEEDDIRRRFPGMFLNVTEIEDRVKAYRNLPGFADVEPGPVRPSNCTDGNCAYKVYVYHTCCCRAEVKLKRPLIVIVNDEPRALAQFDGVNQFFYNEECIQTEHETCKCTPVPLIASAVYTVNRLQRVYATGTFAIGQICKDLNR